MGKLRRPLSYGLEQSALLRCYRTHASPAYHLPSACAAEKASGRRAARKATQDHIVRETQPWLFVTSLEPVTHNAKHIIQIYKTRMQIELGFREFKNTRPGLALRETHSFSSTRLANLLLIGMPACFCLWLIGRLAIQRHDYYLLQANTQRDRI